MNQFKTFKQTLTDILNDDSTNDEEKTKLISNYFDENQMLDKDPEVQEFIQLGNNAFMRTAMLAYDRNVIFNSNDFLLEILNDPYYIYIPGKTLYPRKTIEQIISEQSIENMIPDKTVH